jgi:membrane-bound serine protease (ClpP class)
MKFFFAAMALLFCGSSFADSPAIVKGSVVVLPIHGQISEAQFFFLRRVLKQAGAAEAAAVILDIDTPGGALSATEKIDQAILKSGLPVYSYINTNAASAGALIALSTKAIYMAPVSAIGAAAPVMGSGQEMEATMTAKVVSYYSGYFRSVAAQNDHNPELVDAFMNLDKEVKVGDRVLNPKGALLTLSAQEAVEVVNDKPILAKGIAKTVEDLCEQAGLNAKEIVRIEPSGFESVAQWITILAPMFLMGGIIGAYIEFKSPGFGVAGLLSALCFLLFFAGHYIAGLTGFEVVAVFFLGLILIVVELILFPGILILAAVGTALMLGALFFAMVDFYPSQPMTFSFDAFIMPVANLSIGLALAVLAAALLARFLPELPVFNRLILAKSATPGPSVPVFAGPSVSNLPALGETGIAVTMLRPAGKAQFGESLVDVVTEGEFLEAGTAICVLRAGGDAIVVGRG